MRETTIKLVELAEDGAISWESIARSCLCYLDETEVTDMAQINELIPEDGDDLDDDELAEEEDDDIMNDYNYVGSYWHY